jgi:hypothetical protein
VSRYPLEWVAREQQVALMGDYEQPGQLEAAYTPYRSDNGHWALGQPGETPYDLNVPEHVLELKTALYELAKRDTDPFRNPGNPILEERWKDMILDGRYASSWDGASADEFVLAISRYVPGSGITGPFMQIAGSKFGRGILGGPQPTAKGLEVIAGAVQQRLGGVPPMTSYLKWRGGTINPPSDWSGPGDEAVVLPITRMGPVWEPYGYTPVADDGVPEWVGYARQVDESLLSCWQAMAAMTGATEEQRRLALQDCVLTMRQAHHQAALKANANQPDPECPEGLVYHRDKGECGLPGVVTLPEIDIETTNEQVRQQCIDDYMAEGMSRREAEKICPYGQSRLAGVAMPVAIGAAAALGFWYFTRKRKSR